MLSERFSQEMLRHRQRGGFTFKQFHLCHEGCAMKVGTDAILLGAWAPLNGVLRALDIGTGSGIVSLMLAQRSQGCVTIEALDIDSGAVLQAQQNVAFSPWPAAVRCTHLSLQAFGSEPFDLLISNPPYFEPGQAFECEARQTARHTGALSHAQLLADAARLSHELSSLALVLPVAAALAISRCAPNYGWHLAARCEVRSSELKPVIRQLLLFMRQQGGGVIESELTIHQMDGRYSDAYIALCRDFYLKM
jgi:tRNA1Val (adenine37-N6)-methyltransferase